MYIFLSYYYRNTIIKITFTDCDWQTVQIVSKCINIILVVYIDVSLRDGALAEVYLISTIQMQLRFEIIDTNFAVFFLYSEGGSMIT